jgi:hypothetical protein
MALAVAGALAGGSVGSSPAPEQHARVVEGVAKAPLKCLKYKRLHGKRVCVKRAKAKPKPKPKPVGTTTATTTTTTTTAPAGPMAGSYTGVSSQNASIQFTVSGSQLQTLVFGEIDGTCSPGGWEYAIYGDLGDTLTIDAAGKVHASIPVTTTSGNTGSVAFDATVDASGRATGSYTLTITVGGTGGPYACSSGAVTWTGGTGAAAPPPPQHAKPGHYAGTTSQGAAFLFDVAPSGSILMMTQLTFPELDEDCDPGQIHLAFTGFRFVNLLVDAAGNVRELERYDDDSTGFHETFSIVGAIDTSGHASGTINDAWTLPQGGTTYTCGSGPVTWTATQQ